MKKYLLSILSILALAQLAHADDQLGDASYDKSKYKYMMNCWTGPADTTPSLFLVLVGGTTWNCDGNLNVGKIETRTEGLGLLRSASAIKLACTSRDPVGDYVFGEVACSALAIGARCGIGIKNDLGGACILFTDYTSGNATENGLGASAGVGKLSIYPPYRSGRN